MHRANLLSLADSPLDALFLYAFDQRLQSTKSLHTTYGLDHDIQPIDQLRCPPEIIRAPFKPAGAINICSPHNSATVSWPVVPVGLKLTAGKHVRDQFDLTLANDLHSCNFSVTDTEPATSEPPETEPHSLKPCSPLSTPRENRRTIGRSLPVVLRKNIDHTYTNFLVKHTQIKRCRNFSSDSRSHLG